MNTTFKTAADFRKSLEARLQFIATKTGEDLQRLRRKVAFDRFLARIFFQGNPGFYLRSCLVTQSMKYKALDARLF